MFAYHFVSNIDLLAVLIHDNNNTSRTKHIDAVDSAQVELKALMYRIITLFYAECNETEMTERLRMSVNTIRISVMNIKY